MPGSPPFAHLAVTVTDLERSTRGYRELLGAAAVLDAYFSQVVEDIQAYLSGRPIRVVGGPS